MSLLEEPSLPLHGNLISITKAASFTPYSSDYLGLLARKGKLKAIKISRDWLTTREAVLYYVKNQQVKHQKMANDLQAVEGRMA